MADAEDLNKIWLLVKGKWNSDQVKVHQVTERSNIKFYSGDHDAIDHEWLNFLMKKPWTFKGPTIRLLGWHKIKRDNQLILEVIPSDYKEACLLGYLGVAMVPVTEKDDYIVLQDSSKRPHTYSGVGMPGCTPTGTDVLPHVVREMYEEFAVHEIKELSVLGLIQTEPPASPIPNHCLVIKVKYPGTFADLKGSWEENVKDEKERNEGKPLNLKLDKKTGAAPPKGRNDRIKLTYSDSLILLMVIESELKEKGEIKKNLVDYRWPDRIRDYLIHIESTPYGKSRGG